MPKAVKWRQTNNFKIMFDLLKLIQKKQELQLAISGNIINFSDSFRNCYGCESDCSGSCSGYCSGTCESTCDDTCEGQCEGCGNCGSAG